MTLSERGEIISLAFLSILPFLSISKLTRIVARHYSPHGISCKKNIIKECEEEAGIPASISTNVIPVGAVSYMDIEGYRYKRDVLFCYDLKLPPDFVPKNEDGEVDSYRLITVSQAANIIRRTEFYKPNCCLVILDFLFRHGYSLAIDGLVEKAIELSLAQIR
ncbi:Nudix hydrolase 20 [Carex littledalei]|uniref:Nudix hydrolase 20 n=1 Tax=Carex littledalei TaxID=544730 RepID=A0A833R4A1_9POAL|nr:Nudix hydrolase 20 [Carex littledalei]